MGSEISKSDRVLLDSIAALDDTYQQVTSDFGKMRATINELRASGWQGKGSEGFEKAAAEWELQQKKVTDTMVTFSEQLGQAEKTYTVTEDDVSGAFNRYAGGLG